MTEYIKDAIAEIEKLENKQIEPIRKLAYSYNLQLDEETMKNLLCCTFTELFKETDEMVEDIRELIKFMKLCIGSEIQLSGTITTKAEGYVKGTRMKYSIKNEYLQKCIIKLLGSQHKEFGYLEIVKVHSKKITQPQKKGRTASFLKSMLKHIEFKSQRECYSFIYDIMVIRGEANKMDIGFSNEIIASKSTNIKNWIRAYQTFIEKNR